MRYTNLGQKWNTENINESTLFYLNPQGAKHLMIRVDMLF